MPGLKKYGGILGRGVTATFAPSILKGALAELFRIRRVDTKKVTEWVLANNSLWDSLEPERKRQFKHLASKLGDVDFITTEWAIDSLRSDFPGVASLFLGWPKAHNWLERQLDEIKKQAEQSGT